MRTSVRLLLTALVVALWATPADADHQKLDRALRQELRKGTPAQQRVIITVKPGTRPLLRDALRKHGDDLIAEHPSINALTAVVHGEDIEALANDPIIEAVSIDAIVEPGARPEQTPRGASERRAYETLHAQLGLDEDTEMGRGIGVAIIDSGIAPLPDFGTRIVAFRDFSRTGTPLTVNPYDDYGHGTHVAGLIAGSGSQSTGAAYSGVAPSARLIGLKVLDKDGKGYSSAVIAAIDFAVANRELFGIDIINLSLGHPIFEPAGTDPLVLAVERAARVGLVVVVSAGNFGQSLETGDVGYAGITSPANAPSALTVGSLRTNGTSDRSDDKVSNFSSRGPSWYDAYAKPDLVAPGDKLVSNCALTSTLVNLYPSLREKGKRGACYIKLSGTSMSAAVTSGVVALMLEASRYSNANNPPISPNAVKAILQYTAIPVVNPETGDPYDALTQGAGGINAIGAGNIAFFTDTSAPAQSAPVLPVSTIGGREYAWSQNIVWGTNIVWSTSAIWANNIVWSTSVVWGSAVDDNIVWGTAADLDNIVWGTAAETWGDNIVWGTGLITSAVGDDNIVWGTVAGDNIVWGTLDNDNIVWGTYDGDNIVWGTAMGRDGDNIVWGTRRGDDGDNIVWGTRSGRKDNGDNIVWGTRSGPATKKK
ncbi:MAG TPA: S8 family peptidase [Vicinamibacterales bacterium]|nr:S8 family peptidase [Vicinamibacterales bacterium]